MKIGLLLIATGKYDVFIPPLLESAKKYFMKNHEVTYFLFTDSDKFNNEENVIIIPKKHEPYPAPTLTRYNTFHNSKEILSKMDYLFYCDADMRFVGDVGDEILSERVGTLHPGFVGQRGSLETRPQSLACIPDDVNMCYYAGGFNGGSSKSFLEMSDILDKNIKEDSERGITAIWLDESHLNRYFVDNPPTKSLTPSYCYPESWDLPYEKKLLALDKDHQAMRY